MSNTYSCKDCQQVFERVKQQEKTIAQLVEIIGALNGRITDVNQRQMKLERVLVPEQLPRTATSTFS
ncbi:hypothetical protein [Halobacillus sp. Marseille-Q1614]|uniref:hypothetical protein n=1 Tax=Halobacillus sp. Marseille-Q1614 TaxID=2709134 RepID=UPI0015709395|nr:hypothetical protein [Halobacillus sp. Marseille-Q1614]